ncbi:MAG: ATP-binding cassette domain-containing protein [Acholeplasma sp.]|nr:ATP-binding cassette domain-containing protein [Acholeplasma sp.]
MTILSVEKLTKKFKETLAVKDVSFDVLSGEIVSIIGPSGSGKSTLLRLISNLEKKDFGTIRLFDVEVTSSSAAIKRDLYKKVQFIFQDFGLFDHLSVKDNLLLAPLKVFKQDKKTVLTEMAYWLNEFNLSDKVDSYPSELSGGQKQRVAILRALLTNPKLILFDEPTSALDRESVNDLTNIIMKLKNSGMTILIVTHDMSFAKAVSQRLLFMENSSIIFNEYIDNINDQMERLNKYLG